MSRKIVGLSLMFCVADIAAGRVSYEDVEKIITGTAEATSKEWEEMLRAYRGVVNWERYGLERCREIAQQLWSEGKIEQPELVGEKAPDPMDGHWLENGQKIRLS